MNNRLSLFDALLTALGAYLILVKPPYDDHKEERAKAWSSAGSQESALE